MGQDCLSLWSVKDQWKVPTSAVIQMQVCISVCYNTEFIAISPNICLGCRAGQWLGVGGRRERGCVCSDSVPLEDQSKFWPNYQHVYTYTSGPCHLLLSEGEHGSGPTRTNSFSQGWKHMRTKRFKWSNWKAHHIFGSELKRQPFLCCLGLRIRINDLVPQFATSSDWVCLTDLGVFWIGSLSFWTILTDEVSLIA